MLRGRASCLLITVATLEQFVVVLSNIEATLCDTNTLKSFTSVEQGWQN